MKRIEKLAVLLLLTLGLCGCTRTSEVKTDEKLAVQEEVSEKGSERTLETVQVGPETITTTVEEFEVGGGTGPGAPLVTSSAQRESPAVTNSVAPAVSATGHLVKRTVTVDQRGPVVATKTEAATMATTASLTGKQEKASDTKKRTSYWPPWWLWAIGAVGVALGIAVLRKTLLGKAVAAAEAAAKEVL